MAMTKYTTTLPVLATALALVAFVVTPSVVQAQGYDGVVAEGSDDADIGSNGAVYSYGAGEGPDNVFQDNYYQNRAAKKRANSESYRATAQSQRAAAQVAREAEAKAAQQAIDARVDAAVSAPSDYGTRINALKAPPPQMPETTTEQTQTTTPTQTGGSSSGGNTGSGGAGSGGGSAGGGDRGGSVLERMMNSLQ